MEFSKRFSNVHQIIKENIKLNPEDFSGKMQYTGRTINFISNYLSKNISKLQRIDRQNIGSIITESLKIFYWNSFQNKNKLSNLKFDTIKKFKENIKVEIIKEEEEIELNYKELNNLVEKINLYMKDPQNNDLVFSFDLMVKSCEKIKFTDIDKILEKLKKTVDYALKERLNIPENKFYLIMKINIIIFLLEEIKKEKISFINKNNTLFEIEDKNLFSKKSKLLFLSRILDKKKLFNIPSIIISSINYSNRNNIIKLLQLINDFIKEGQGTFVLFKKIIEILNENYHLLRIINLIFPFYRIKDNNNKRMSILWLLLFGKLFDKKIAFKVEFYFNGYLQSMYSFNFLQKNIFPVFKFDTNYDDLYLASGSYINQYDEKGRKSSRELTYKFKEKNGDKEKISIIIYESINTILAQNIEKPTSKFYKNIYDSYINKSISSLVTDFLKNIYYDKRSYDLNLFFKNDFDDNNQSIVGNIIGIIYSSPELSSFISNNIKNKFINKLFNIINLKIGKLDKNDFNENNNLINKYQQLSEEINKLNILLLYIENEDFKKNDDDLTLLNKFKNDIQSLEKIKAIVPELKEACDDYIDSLKDEKSKIENRFSNSFNLNFINREIDNNKKVEIAEKIKELIRKNKDNNNIISILRLLQRKINNDKNLTNEYLDKIKEIINKITKYIKNNELNSNVNEIGFPPIQKMKYKLEKKENNHDIEILNESFILYSYKLNLIENLIKDNENKEYDKIYIINELNKFNEFKNISIILYHKVLEKIEINNNFISKIINTLNANLLIKIKKTLNITYDKIPNILKNLKNKINEYIKCKKLLNPEIELINSISNKYKFNLKLDLPKICPNDILFLFCQLDENEKIVQNINDKDLILKNFVESKFEQLINENIIFNNYKECIGKLKIIISEEKNNKILNSNINDLFNMGISLNNLDNNYYSIKYDLNDCQLILERKVKSPEFYNKYPLIYYWFHKNQSFKFGEIFLNCYKKEDNNNIALEQKISFWLFCLRAHSSINCILSEKISFLDYKIKNILFNHILLIKYNNIGVNWMYLLKNDINLNIQDDFINSISVFIENLRKDKELNENLRKYEQSKTVICIFKKIKELVMFLFDPKNQASRKSLFLFYSNINGEIKDELIEMIRNDYKDYLINGKYISKFINKISVFKDNIIKEKNKFEINYNNLKENLNTILITDYKGQIDKLKNRYNNLISIYNSFNNQINLYNVNSQGKKLEEIINELKEIEFKPERLHVKINSELLDFYNTKINKYKFVIKEDNKTKKSSKYIYCKEQYIMETKENEGFVYYLDNYDNNFICKNNNDIYFQIQCNLIKTFNNGIQKITFTELKKINETEDFINNTEIKIGNMTKNNYDEKIKLILEIFARIINCKNNESELFRYITDLIKNDILNIRNFIPPNDSLILNQKIKYNTQIKVQAEESIVKIDKDIYNIIAQSKNFKKKYEEYKNKLNKIQVENIFNKDYSLKKLSKEESLKCKIDFKEINKNIILDYTPIIYYDDKENKIKCIYQEINYNTDIFLYDYYKYA